MTHRPAPPRPTSSASYVAPALTPLGRVESVTSGPDSAKTLDGIVGGGGGFNQSVDPSS